MSRAAGLRRDHEVRREDASARFAPREGDDILSDTAGRARDQELHGVAIIPIRYGAACGRRPLVTISSISSCGVPPSSRS